MGLAVVLFIIGIILIVKGGDFFVDAASWMAEVSGIPKFVVGATVVSLATTLPELLVSSMAAAEGKVDMAIGNAIGSVTANTGMIMAIGVFFMLPVMKRKQLLPKGILLLMTVGALWFLSMGGSLTIRESIVLLVIFIVFIIINVMEAKEGTALNTDEKPDHSGPVILTNIGKFVFGAAGIVVGSQLLVDNGSFIAAELGVPEKVIALTAVAIGTSLPELVTTITAIIKKQSSLSVGNIIGANIIDCALILPVCAMISKGSIEVSRSTIYLDMPVCALVCAIMLVPSFFTQKFQKWQALTAFVVYIVYLVMVCA
ncbi:sodium:calcium antiporter [bacterium C-53]|nr:sodium:calcium antiporter [Lachnospiraceae bacterium]NBI02400.1 sodium:calcium antiporter [Lachnospiraceae bacterium]RKJ11950.1 sodium:calcium antiporter [bacterium C-53]